MEQTNLLKDRCFAAGKALQILLKREGAPLGADEQRLHILESLQKSLSLAAEHIEYVEQPESRALQQKAFDAAWMHARRHNEGELLCGSGLSALLNYATANTVEQSDALARDATSKPEAIPLEGDIVIDSASEKSIALILPWADASYKHYREIARLYRNLGLATVIYNCPTTAPSEVRAGNAAKLLQVLDSLISRGAHRILVHAMSMNGSIMWARLVQLGQGHASLHAICGIVFDSAPILKAITYLDVTIADVAMQDSQGAMPGILQHSTGGEEIARNAYIAGYLAGYADQLASGMVATFAFREQWYVDVLFQKWPALACKKGIPCLALYSDKDLICRKEFVQEALNVFQKHGVRLVSKEFHGSSHCGHHRQFESDYAEVVARFVAGLLPAVAPPSNL